MRECSGERTAQSRSVCRLKVRFHIVRDHDIGMARRQLAENGAIVRKHNDPRVVEVGPYVLFVGAAWIDNDTHLRFVYGGQSWLKLLLVVTARENCLAARGIGFGERARCFAR